LLDEPTNHLDIPAQEMLEEALNEYEGTIVFVSHDRYFIDDIATHLWVVEKGSVSMHLGNYSDYERRRQHRLRAVPERAGKDRQSRPVEHRQELAGPSVEDQIGQLETEVHRIEEQLSDHQTYDDPSLVAELSRAYDDASRRLRALYEEWEQAAGA
jgi:ATP-binding cassette subfamily F protein 3